MKVVGYGFDVDCAGKDNCKLQDNFLGYRYKLYAMTCKSVYYLYVYAPYIFICFDTCSYIDCARGFHNTIDIIMSNSIVMTSSLWLQWVHSYFYYDYKRLIIWYFIFKAIFPELFSIRFFLFVIIKFNLCLIDQFYSDPRPHRTFANIRYALYEYWLRQYTLQSYILILDFRDTFFQGELSFQVINSSVCW